MVGLRELDVLVGYDLHAIAPRVPEVEAPGRDAVGVGRFESPLDRVAVVHDETEVAVVVGAAGVVGLREREELVARVDEGRRLASSPEFELEQRFVEVEGLVHVADFERHVVDADRSGSFVVRVGHGRSDGSERGRRGGATGTRTGSGRFEQPP